MKTHKGSIPFSGTKFESIEMAQSRIYLKCEICNEKFYLARLSSVLTPLEWGTYDTITSIDLQQFFDTHGHGRLNGEQYSLEYL